MPSTRTPVMLLLLLFAGSALADTKPSLPRPPGPPRKVASAHEAWVGHWRSEDGKTDYYVTPHDLIMVDDGSAHTQLWAVLEEEAHTMECAIVVQQPGADPNRGHIKKMTFSADYRKIDYTITIRGKTIDSRIFYIDELQNPPR